VLEPVEKARTIQNALLQAFQGMVSIQETFMKQGKAKSLEYYHGVTKEEAIKAKKQQQSVHVVTSDAFFPTNATSKKVFVLCQVHIDFRHRKSYHQYVSCALTVEFNAIIVTSTVYTIDVSLFKIG
jgi:hypothetical protein